MPGEAGDPNIHGPEVAQAAQERSGDGSRDPNTIQLLGEEFSVDRETVETGRVRVKVATREHEETFDVPLTEEHVEVERVPIGREIEAVPPQRQEGDTIVVPVVEEVIVMRRKLMLKEEVRLKLVRSTEQHRENVTLRRQEAVIERLPMEQLPAEQKSDQA